MNDPAANSWRINNYITNSKYDAAKHCTLCVHIFKNGIASL